MEDNNTMPKPPQPTVEMSKDVGELFEALSAFQGDMPEIERSKKVTVKMKRGGTYNFNYAPLPEVLKAIKKPLTSNGLAVSQVFTGEDIVTVLTHKSGQFMISTMPVKLDHGNPQDTGEAITYKRRYSLESILGISASDDTDANGVAGNSMQSRSSGSGTTAPKTNSTGATLPKGKKSGDLNATEVAKLIRDVPNSELEGFLSKDEERVTVLKVWETKVGYLPDYLKASGGEEESGDEPETEPEQEEEETSDDGVPNFNVNDYDNVKDLVSSYNEMKSKFDGFKEKHFADVQARMRELNT